MAWLVRHVSHSQHEAFVSESKVAVTPPSAITVCPPVRRGQRSKRSVRLFLLKAQPGNGTLDFRSHSLGWNFVTWPCLAVQEVGGYSHQLCDHVLGKTQAF